MNVNVIREIFMAVATLAGAAIFGPVIVPGLVRSCLKISVDLLGLFI